MPAILMKTLIGAGMKKMKILAFAIAFLLILTACREKNNTSDEPVSTTSQTVTATSEPVPTAETTAEPVPTAETTAEPVPIEEKTGFFDVYTGYDPQNSAHIIFDGDTITLEGIYTFKKATAVFLSGNRYAKSEFSGDSGGKFTAKITTETVLSAVDKLCIRLADGDIISFRVEYGENGWHIPDNGLAEKNAALFDKIKVLPKEVVEVYISPTADKTEISETLAEIKSISDEVCKGLKSDYDKARAVSEWISANIYYDFDASHTNVDLDTIALVNVLERRRTVCTGYANLYAAMLQAQGIRCVSIAGSSASSGIEYEDLLSSPQNHQWSAAYIDGRWVYADTIWDTGNAYNNGRKSNSYLYLKHFDISDEMLALIHRGDSIEERGFFEVD